ncbi:MAG: HD domain-containing protein [Armatimonadetes bacterium]|nr:HD domain-containing protein [Armatimonadota bacterium]
MSGILVHHGTRWRAAVAAGVLFAAISMCACFLVAAWTSQAFQKTQTDELASIARLSALQVDGDAHERLTEPGQMSSKSYEEQSERLRRVLSNVRNVRFVYTVRPAHGGFVFILDPTVFGDADRDGVDDKSYLMDPVEAVTPGMVNALATGLVQVDDKPLKDKWGTWLSAYAPVRDSSGKVVAVLGIDRDYRLVQARLDQVWTNAVLIALLAGALAIAATLILAKTESLRWASMRRRGNRLRRRLLEFLLMTCVCGILIEGASLASRAQQTSDQKRSITVDMTATESVRTAVSKAGRAERVDEREWQAVAEKAATSSMTWLGIEADQVRRSDPPLAKVRAAVLTEKCDQVMDELRSQLSVSAAQEASFIRSVVTLLMLAISLAVGCVLVLRLTSTHDERLAAAVVANDEFVQDQRSFLHSLPISVFAFTAQECVFRNPSWEEMTGWHEGREPMTCFLEAVHSEDTASVKAALENARTLHQAVVVEHRIVKPTGQVLWVETRLSTVKANDGTYRYTLAFSLDTTATRAAERAMSEKNDEIVRKNALLSRTLTELEDNLESIVRAMVRAIEAKDIYTAGHSERVMQYSLWIGQEMGLGPYELRVLEMGALVHDIGKIGVPDDVLTKPGKLTESEFRLVQKHPVYGANIMGGIPSFKDCLPIVKWHHERLNGTGYPDGLVGDEIPLLVRIAAVADVFDAMTTTRSYRSSIPIAEVVQMMWGEVEAGKLDGAALQALESALRKRSPLMRERSEEQAA